MNKIPKKLHMYWDRSPMSRLQALTVETFKQLNPDWSIYVYIPKQSYDGNYSYIPDYVGKDYFWYIEHHKHVNIIEVDMRDYGIDDGLHNILRSDILRYHLLYNSGGVWSDFDVVWLKPMYYLSEIVKADDFDLIICTYEKETIHHNISVLISAPYTKFYEDLISRCNSIQHEFKGRPNHQEYGTKMWNEMFSDSKTIVDKYYKTINVPYETFFPCSIHNMEKLFLKTDASLINDGVMGVHWFNGHVLSKQYVNEDRFSNCYPCSMTELLKTDCIFDAYQKII